MHFRMHWNRFWVYFKNSVVFFLSFCFVFILSSNFISKHFACSCTRARFGVNPTISYFIAISSFVLFLPTIFRLFYRHSKCFHTRTGRTAVLRFVFSFRSVCVLILFDYLLNTKLISWVKWFDFHLTAHSIQCVMCMYAVYGHVKLIVDFYLNHSIHSKRRSETEVLRRNVLCLLLEFSLRPFSSFRAVPLIKIIKLVRIWRRWTKKNFEGHQNFSASRSLVIK